MRTLATYRELDTDMILRGFFDWILEEDAMLANMAVREVLGNGVLYNVRTTRAGASWTQPGDTIPESTGTTTQRSAALSILIGDADVDKFAKKTNKTQDPEVLEIQEKSKDVVHEWSERAIYVQTTTSSNTNQPKGLFKLLAEVESTTTTDLDGPNNSQVVAPQATSGALVLANMDELTDAVHKPNGYIMTKRARRKLNTLAQAAGTNLVHDRDQLGFMLSFYGGIPIYINEHMEDTLPNNSSSVLDITSYAIGTTRAASNDNFVIFCVRMAEDGFTIIQAGAFEHEVIGTVQNKDATRHRFKWYTGLGLFDKFAAAVLTGVLDTAL